MNKISIYVPIYPVCTNDMYIPTAGKLKEGNKRRSAFLRKSKELIDFQHKFNDYMHETKMLQRLLDFHAYNVSKYKYLGYKLRIYVGIPATEFYYKDGSKNLRSHDASNFIKSVEDAISELLAFDDKYNLEVSSVKYASNRDFWNFYATLEVIKDYTVNYDEDFIVNNLLGGIDDA